MKSQKISNRSPRPFSKQSSSRSWGGEGFIPGSPKPAVKKAQPKVQPSEEVKDQKSPPAESKE